MYRTFVHMNMYVYASICICTYGCWCMDAPRVQYTSTMHADCSRGPAPTADHPSAAAVPPPATAGRRQPQPARQQRRPAQQRPALPAALPGPHSELHAVPQAAAQAAEQRSGGPTVPRHKSHGEEKKQTKADTTDHIAPHQQAVIVLFSDVSVWHEGQVSFPWGAGRYGRRGSCF